MTVSKEGELSCVGCPIDSGSCPVNQEIEKYRTGTFNPVDKTPLSVLIAMQVICRRLDTPRV